MNDSIKNIESTQTDYRADCAVTPSNSMAFAKEANYIGASNIELEEESVVYTAPDLTF
ncbi:hypothetical protein [Wolbachia endosymbiont of Folsomia candida]|uniref:hypothetical protein n=1 Tax=Wolbachia endosymbiont of Folsomia candida TaxID=169402 RepID=UPI000A71ABD2|nr:hypothetical protein [Wolbachia endosymbiont of Folsomia candida]